MIGSVAKYFRFSWHEIMFEISYSNLMLMLASIPDYSKDDDNYEYEGSDLEFVNFFSNN